MPVPPARLHPSFACGKALLYTLLCLAVALPLHAARSGASGIAWRVKGVWHAVGKDLPIENGDAVQPASLLSPGGGTGSHSITVLLPDGQRVLYECFAAADCARGFRVPALTRRPDPFALHMIARVRAALLANRNRKEDSSAADRALQAARDEAVAVIDPAHRVHLSGLIADLSPGQYTFDLRPLDAAHPAQYQQPLQKTSAAVNLRVPASGLYVLTIADALHSPRINLFFAAIEPAQSARFASFDRARELLEDWNSDYGGWPVDDFLRAYLQSLAQMMAPASQQAQR